MQRQRDDWKMQIYVFRGLTVAVKKFAWSGEVEPESRAFLIYQCTTTDQTPIISLWFFMAFLLLCTETIKYNKNHPLKISGLHYIAISSKSQKSLELVSNLHNRRKNELEMFLISHTNIWPNFTFTPPMILRKQSKVFKNF